MMDLRVKNYSLHGEKRVLGVYDFLRHRLPLIVYAPVSRLLCRWIYSKNSKRIFKYKSSLCLIFKDEAHYIKEWIEYHELLGIEHFYLYNNNSTDNFREILQPYLDSGLVSLIDFPEQFAQVKAYNDCYLRAKDETEWLGYIDTDEYINLIQFDSINDFLDQYRTYPNIQLNWRVFGTSGHEKENFEELTIERYTQCWECLDTTGKGFINNNFDGHRVEVHFHKCNFIKFPLLGCLTNKGLKYNRYAISTKGIGEIAYLNHYWSRSSEFYFFKDFVKGSAASKENNELRKQPQRFRVSELRNISKDFSIQRWLIFLKEKMR